jgi:hypothetical protein
MPVGCCVFANNFVLNVARSTIPDSSSFHGSPKQRRKALFCFGNAATAVYATGVGCFFGDGMHTLLGVKDHAWQSLYHFTAGGAVDNPRLSAFPPYEV